ncbi:MAG TPA: HPF/RaiA family ribosome-associated protein, partial [Thermoanaerobaculia bacterium]|nr:HPF/RaiA family ribosome-associated protein [Thermoanaerobaculia bacterium]
MKIDVRFRGIQVSEALREYAVRRVRFQLSRFDGDVGSVVVRIGDVNGPRGGVDKRCLVEARGPAFGPVAVEDASTDAYTAVGSAVGRAARAVGREIERARVGQREDGPVGE